MPVRDAKRRGEGWLAGCAYNIGWSNSPGWYEGSCLLVVDQTGMLACFGFAASTSTRDRPSAETLFAPKALGLAPGSRARDRRPRDRTWSTQGLRGEDKHRRWLAIDTGCWSSARTQRAQEELAQSAAARGSEHLPDRRNRPREALRCLRTARSVATPHDRVAEAVGGRGGAAQLLYLARRGSRPPSAGLRGLASRVIPIHNKRLTIPVCGRRSYACPGWHPRWSHRRTRSPPCPDHYGPGLPNTPWQTPPPYQACRRRGPCPPPSRRGGAGS
jgi:hypothetical protein